MAGVNSAAGPPAPNGLTELDVRAIRGRGFTERDIRLLYSERQSVLAKLSVISGGTTGAVPDGSGMTLHKRTDRSTAKARALADSPGARPKRASESQLPPGTHQQTDLSIHKDGPPNVKEDILGHYVYRFQAARGDYWQIKRLCAQANRDIERETIGNRRPFNEDGPAKDRRILSDYEGLAPWEVAYWEDCSPSHVERLRRGALLNPADGMEVEVDERTARIVGLKREGKSLREIGAAVGVSYERVRQVLVGA